LLSASNAFAATRFRPASATISLTPAMISAARLIDSGEVGATT